MLRKNLIQKIKIIANEILKEAIIKRCPIKDKDDRPESQQQWCLYNKNKTRLLGRHPTKEKAKEQEKAVQYFKHKNK
jgi:hypothetical protein